MKYLCLVYLEGDKLHAVPDVTQYFASLGIPAPHAQALLVSLVEIGGGILLVLGLGTRHAALLLAGVMVVAIWTAKLPEVHGVIDRFYERAPGSRSSMVRTRPCSRATTWRASRPKHSPSCDSRGCQRACSLC